MKKIIPLILIILVSSCAKINEDKIIGTWEVEDVESEVQEDARCFLHSCEGEEMIITEDEIIARSLYYIDYLIENGKLNTLGMEYKLTFIGKKLIMKSDYNKAVLKRK